MVGVCIPRRLVRLVGLVTPACPSFALTARKKLKVRSSAARLQNPVLLFRFTRMLPLATAEVIHLRATGFQRARILAADSKQHKFGHVPKVKPNTSSI